MVLNDELVDYGSSNQNYGTLKSPKTFAKETDLRKENRQSDTHPPTKGKSGWKLKSFKALKKKESSKEINLHCSISVLSEILLLCLINAC